MSKLNVSLLSIDELIEENQKQIELLQKEQEELIAMKKEETQKALYKAFQNSDIPLEEVIAKICGKDLEELIDKPKRGRKKKSDMIQEVDNEVAASEEM